jgi:flagellar basal-body rod modification protein FlgD
VLTNAVATNPAAQLAAQTSGSNSTNGSNSSGSTGNSAFGGGLDGMFMQLLVTQLQNQDPTSPMDPSTFVTQLVGVTTLDQVTQINSLLQGEVSGTSTSGSTSQDSSSINNILGGV